MLSSYLVNGSDFSFRSGGHTVNFDERHAVVVARLRYACSCRAPTLDLQYGYSPAGLPALAGCLTGRFALCFVCFMARLTSRVSHRYLRSANGRRRRSTPRTNPISAAIDTALTTPVIRSGGRNARSTQNWIAPSRTANDTTRARNQFLTNHAPSWECSCAITMMSLSDANAGI